MKRTALTLVLVLILSLILTSCQYIGSITPSLPGVDNESKPKPDPTSEDELMERVSDTMDALVSYRTRLSMKFDYVFNDTQVKSNMDSLSIYVNNPGEEFFYTTVSTETYVDTVKETYDQIIAYDDGMLYLSDVYGSYTAKICSKISLDDFREFYEDTESDPLSDDMLSSAFSKEFKKNEDSTWTLEYSKLARSSVKKLAKEIGFDYKTFGIDFKDVSISFAIDEAFRATELTLSFYADSDTTPVITATATYSDFNTAEKIELRKNSYTEVDDARIPRMVNEYIDEFPDHESGSAAISLIHTHRNSSSAVVQPTTVYSESDNITFENVDDNISYTINKVVDGESMLIDYSGGAADVTYNGDTTTTAMTNTEAAQLLSQFLDSAKILNYEVRQVTKVTNTLYQIDCRLSDATRFGLPSNYSLNRSFSYVVDIRDGEVYSIKYTFQFSNSSSTDKYYRIEYSMYLNPENN